MVIPQQYYNIDIYMTKWGGKIVEWEAKSKRYILESGWVGDQNNFIFVTHIISLLNWDPESWLSTDHTSNHTSSFNTNRM